MRLYEILASLHLVKITTRSYFERGVPDVTGPTVPISDNVFN
jgi:hypothetical protein